MRKASILYDNKSDTLPNHDLSPPPTSKVAQPQLSVEIKKKIEKEAITETTKEEIKLKKTHSDRLKSLVNRGRVYLFRTSAIFPFDLFPDELSIELDQVNVCIKSFFLTGESRSILIKNIADIYLSTSFLFASLKIIDTSYIENSVEISYLRKDEAERARRIIQGLILASKEEVDLSKIDPKRLLSEAERIGTMKGVDWQVQ